MPPEALREAAFAGACSWSYAVPGGARPVARYSRAFAFPLRRHCMGHCEVGIFQWLQVLVCTRRHYLVQ
jgi:hypothetical protein